MQLELITTSMLINQIKVQTNDWKLCIHFQERNINNKKNSG